MRTRRHDGQKARAERFEPRPRAGSHQAASGWIYGRHAALAAIANPARRLNRILAVAELMPAVEAVATAAGGALPPVETVDRRAFAVVLGEDAVHQGIAVLAEPLPQPALEELLFSLAGEDAVLLVLDQVTDPRNVGAVLRSAAAFAATAVLMQARHAPSLSGALAKAASGGLERVPVIAAVNLARALRALQAAGFWVVGLAGNGDREIVRSRLTGRVALVFGAEDTGLRRLVRETCDELARIPTQGPLQSLNISVAAAITLYERARRQEPRPLR